MERRKENHPAGRLLGQVYYRLGHHTQAAELLEPYVEYNPWDEEARGWLSSATDEPGPAESLVVEQAVAQVAGRREFPLDLQQVSRPAHLEGVAEQVVTRDRHVGDRSGLSLVLEGQVGLRAAVWVGSEGADILAHSGELTEENVLALAEVVQAGERACLDMDIGRLGRAVISGPAGTVVVVGFGNGSLVSYFTETLRPQEADLALTQALERAGVLAGETSRA